jgi:chaperonin cofactor prefoldin
MTFGQVLNRVARKRLADGVKERYETVKGDLATYQKAKKKL